MFVVFLAVYIVGYLISVRLIAKLILSWQRRELSNLARWDSGDDMFCLIYALLWPVTLPVVALTETPAFIRRHFNVKLDRPFAKLTGVKDER